MTKDQIIEALQQVVSDCKDLEVTDYHSVSLRGELYKLGYNSEDADEAITFAFNEGFNYCIDPMFPSNNERTPEFATYWGPDQLRSRLEWFLPRKFNA